MSDQYAEEEAIRLLANKPAVLIYVRDLKTLTEQERSWRFGKKSGMRALVAACDTLAKGYVLMQLMILAFDQKAMVFVKPENKLKYECAVKPPARSLTDDK